MGTTTNETLQDRIELYLEEKARQDGQRRRWKELEDV